MLLLDHTCETPTENLALDEALLEQAERGGEPREVLRLWEPAAPLVVVGRSSQVQDEVDEATCAGDGVPVFRRVSGGAAVVGGPGCLMYAVVLSYRQRPELRNLDAAHRLVMETLRDALRPHVPGVEHRGICDLTLGGRKFSGNSVRCRREHLLYHGTLLYDFPLADIGRWLKMPPRQPDYRSGRRHLDFVTNLPLPATTLRRAIAEGWQVTGVCGDWPRDEVARLVREKYDRAEWNERR